MGTSKVINKEDICKLVEIFYQHEFRTFNVNSVDGVKFVKPIGIFVSLGLTTSLKAIENIKSILEDNGYVARIAEITSKKVGSQYLNTLISKGTPKQYETVFDKSVVLNEEESRKELARLESKLNMDTDLETLTKITPKASILRKLIDRLTSTGGWKTHYIQVGGDNGYSIFHRYINYRKDENLEYRVGIYISK